MHIITCGNYAIFGSIALKALLSGCATAWSPRDLNIAAPRRGTQPLIAFLNSIGYNLNNHNLQRTITAGTITHRTYANSNGRTITITESKEQDSFLGVITGTNHTASMNFISGDHFVSLYPIQSLKKRPHVHIAAHLIRSQQLPWQKENTPP